MGVDNTLVMVYTCLQGGAQLTDQDIEAVREAIKQLRRWGRSHRWGGGQPSLVIAASASVALDRIEERLKPQQIRLLDEEDGWPG